MNGRKLPVLFRQVALAGLWVSWGLLVQGCTGPSGSASLFKAGSDGVLGSVFVGSDMQDAVKKTNPDVDMQGEDVYQIFLSDGYFKYLPDFGGVNEVVIIAEFTEVSSGTKGDTVTTVLGPFEGVADKSKAPAFSKLLYGPKKMESDQVSVTISVIEYDQGENEDAAAFLDFIASASQVFSFINPVTATERAFTKEIAKNLLALNKDEVVLRVSFDLVADSGHLKQYSNVNGALIPLAPGNYVLVNQEGCAVTSCFGYLSEDQRGNPVALLGDAVLAIPVALRQGLTDTPDGISRKDIAPSEMRLADQRLTNVKDGTRFSDKTWLTLSVVKGGDPSLWAKRKLLLSAEEAVQRIGKSAGNRIQTSNDYDAALEALKAARQQEQADKGTLKLATALDKNGNYTFSNAAREICLFHPVTVNASTLQAHFYRLVDGKPRQPVVSPEIKPEAGRSTPNNSCFSATPSAMSPGNYQVESLYSIDTQNHHQTLTYTIP
ncbi:hypothetical protein [Pseudomonas sp. Marseille-P9899]|uniref:hypothetical protein n=1 Tax=Pseudomonas sp. Marseille-P9899 TaxID=2730401 RepID=UPI00158A1B36|nr:hypothetical protein [Pseudomonas sp. Marseille-P9899]